MHCTSVTERARFQIGWDVVSGHQTFGVALKTSAYYHVTVCKGRDRRSPELHFGFWRYQPRLSRTTPCWRIKNRKWHVSLLCFKHSGHRCANGRDVCRTHHSTWGFRLRTIVYFFVYRKSWPGTEKLVHLEARGCQCSFKFRGNTSSWAWIAIFDSWYARRLIIGLYLKLLMVTLAERRVHLHTCTCWYFPSHNETWFTDLCHT